MRKTYAAKCETPAFLSASISIALMPVHPPHLRLIVTLCLASALSLSAATVDYEKQLLPVLKDNCLPCHNKTTTKGGLDMETVDLMLKGGDNGPSLVPGDGSKSLLFLAAAGEWDSEMPPKNNKVSAQPLNSGQLALLRQWIDEGAHHRGKQQRVIAWQPLPAGFTPIYAAAITRDGQFAAAARGNQVSLYHLPIARLITRLTDDALIHSGLYSKPGIAHRDVVPALAFSPDGQRLVTGSYREVKVWRLTPQKTAPQPTDQATTPQSKLKLAPSSSVGILTLLDTTSGEKLREIQHGAAITASAISPDGQKLATAGTDHKLKLWETSTGKLLREITGDLDSTHSLNAATLATDRAALEVSWWTEQVQKSDKETTDLNTRLKKGQELQTAAQKTLEDKRRDAQAKATAQTQAEAAVKALETPPPAPSAATPATAEATPAPQPDAAQTQKLTAAREAAAKANTETKTAQEALTRAQAAVQDAEQEIQLVTRLIAEAQKASAAAKTALDQGKKDQDHTAKEKAAALESTSKALTGVQALAFSPDAAQIAALDSTGRLRTWATHTGQPVSSARPRTTLLWHSSAGPTLHTSAPIPDPAHTLWQLERTFGSGDTASPITDRVNALAFSPDGKTLAIGSGEPSRSGDITLWDTATGSLKARWDEVHLDSVLTLAFSPDGHHLASGAADKNLRILHTVTGKVERVLEGHTHHILSTAWRADGRLLATAGADAVVKVWDTATGERRQNITGWDKEITALHWLGATDTLVTTAGDGRIRLITSSGKEVKVLPSTPDFQNTLALTPEGHWLLTGGQDGTLRLWSTPESRETAAFPAEH